MLTPEETFVLAWADSIRPSEARSHVPEKWERVTGLVDRARVREAFQAARSAPQGVPGEPFRSELRLLVPPYLAIAGEGDRESRREFPGDPGGQIMAAIASYSSSPGERRRALRRVGRLQGRRIFQEVFRSWDRAARDAGASGWSELLDASSPVPCGPFLAAVETTGVDPAFEAIHSAARARWSRSPWSRPETRREAEEDVPFLERLGDRTDLFPADHVLAALRGLAAAMGEDPDAAGPLVRAPNVRWSFATALESVGVRGEAVVGSHGGPGGLRDGLLAFGLAIRHQVRSKASAIPGGDPAFRWASSELFGRIALRGRGLRRWIPDPPEEARLDLAFEAALAPRVAWARANDLSCGDDDWKRALERVTGRPASPTRTLDAGPLAEDRAATLRGMILAALLEEHLLLRHGYAWWESISAVSVLKELWICERGETAESVARSLGLGTMDPSMIADAFRP